MGTSAPTHSRYNFISKLGGPVCRPYAQRQQTTARQSQAQNGNRTGFNFPLSQPPVGRQEFRWPLRFCAPEILQHLSGERSRKRGPGKGEYGHGVPILSRPRRRFAQSIVAPGEAQRSGFAGKRRSKGAVAVFAVRRKRRQADFATTSRRGQSNSPPAGGEIPPAYNKPDPKSAHPPQCAHWGTFPQGEGLYKKQKTPGSAKTAGTGGAFIV